MTKGAWLFGTTIPEKTSISWSTNSGRALLSWWSSRPWRRDVHFEYNDTVADSFLDGARRMFVNETQVTLHFPPYLSHEERRRLHIASEDLGIKSRSKGTGSARFLMLLSRDLEDTGVADSLIRNLEAYEKAQANFLYDLAQGEGAVGSATQPVAVTWNYRWVCGLTQGRLDAQPRRSCRVGAGGARSAFCKGPKALSSIHPDGKGGFSHRGHPGG